jgi:Uma2 family endonuclease
MATLVTPVDQSIVLHNVRWETYEQLLTDHEHNPGTRFFYDDGELEIMVVSARHENPNRVIADVILLLCGELRIRAHPIGSTTIKRKRLQKGFEADSAYYFARADQIRPRDVDPETDPPPDLVIEVDVTSPSLPRFPIFAAFGVLEVWRYVGPRLEMYVSEGGQYIETASSLAIPPLTADMATEFINERDRLDLPEWVDFVRDWARQQR